MKGSIFGLGNDLVEVDRIRKILDRHGLIFIEKIFNQEEINYCLSFKDPTEHFAGRFAAKEAIAKALGTGFSSKLGWKDIVIKSLPTGQPIVTFHEKVYQNFGPINILLSISHTKNLAFAVAVAFK